MRIEPDSSQAIAAPAPIRHVFNGTTMGTRYAAVFYSPAPIERDTIAAALQASVDAVDRQMSTWIADSDLMRFNRAAVSEWIEVPAELLLVVGTGLEIGRLSEGAFDIGVGDLVCAWGFNAKNGTPDGDAIEQLARVPRPSTHEILELDREGGRMRKLAPVALDLSGIAKGYGVDCLAETLERFEIADYIVSIDGEVRAAGHKPGGEAWRVAVEEPDREARGVAGVIELETGALATSGDYRHWVELGGYSFSHTMDPRTGRPVTNKVAAVTVRAPSCMLADGWATALLVAGDVAGRQMAAAAGVEAMFAVHADQTRQMPMLRA